jgi:hypothetical protein
MPPETPGSRSGFLRILLNSPLPEPFVQVRFVSKGLAFMPIYRDCHPERSHSQFHSEWRSRRTCGLLVVPILLQISGNFAPIPRRTICPHTLVMCLPLEPWKSLRQTSKRYEENERPDRMTAYARIEGGEQKARSW